MARATVMVVAVVKAAMMAPMMGTAEWGWPAAVLSRAIAVEPVGGQMAVLPMSLDGRKEGWNESGKARRSLETTPCPHSQTLLSLRAADKSRRGLLREEAKLEAIQSAGLREVRLTVDDRVVMTLPC
jgi:hypothetical protein